MIDAVFAGSVRPLPPEGHPSGIFKQAVIGPVRLGPEGLAGDAIPLEARIIAVADALETMLRERVYRQPLSPQQAYQEILDGSGTRYDPAVVQAFSAAWDEIKKT